jgi:hypothetical protein
MEAAFLKATQFLFMPSRGKTMKNRSSKTILVFLALGLISCALCVQQAQAVAVYGVITFAGGVTLDTATVNTAQQVTGWLDGDGNMPTVESVSGNLDFFVNAGDTATFANPWTFGSGVSTLWQVDGFTFDLIASNIVFQGSGFLSVSGTGTALIPQLSLGALPLRMTHQTACFPFLARIRPSPTGVLRLLCWEWHWRESKASAENSGGQRADGIQHLKLGRFPRSLIATLATLPSMSLLPSLHSVFQYFRHSPHS